jgi:hypothetical protein
MLYTHTACCTHSFLTTPVLQVKDKTKNDKALKKMTIADKKESKRKLIAAADCCVIAKGDKKMVV